MCATFPCKVDGNSLVDLPYKEAIVILKATTGMVTLSLVREQVYSTHYFSLSHSVSLSERL